MTITSQIQPGKTQITNGIDAEPATKVRVQHSSNKMLILRPRTMMQLGTELNRTEESRPHRLIPLEKVPNRTSDIGIVKPTVSVDDITPKREQEAQSKLLNRILNAVTGKLEQLIERLSNSLSTNDLAIDKTSEFADINVPDKVLENLGKSEIYQDEYVQNRINLDKSSKEEALLKLKTLLADVKETFGQIKENVGKGKDIFGSLREGWGKFKEFAKSALTTFGDSLVPVLRSIGKIFKKGWEYAKNLLSCP